MHYNSREQLPDPSVLDVVGTLTLGELAGLLRTLRRRHARQRRDSELTYRELAARTGWSHTAIAEYFTGKTLPPIDRFDILIGLLGATPGEQGALATARDRVAEHHRRTPRRTGGRTRKPAVRQLPADVAGFSGRAEHLALLDAFLADPRRETPTAAITAVSGTPGVGKTALAVHWAHRVANRFPDGQLYVNLRGFDPTGSAMSTGDAILRFLDALNVPPRRIPPDLDAKADLYRREIAGRRMLILLDDAHDPAQVRSLLPGTPGCLVLLTSRSPLSGLVAAHSVHPIALDVLTEDEAREFLIRRLGAGRVRAEPDAVAEIITRCARLPLYVVAEQLREIGLDTFASAEDPAGDVRAVFSTSYRTLTPRAARLFRLLGLHPGPDIAVPAAASLAAVPEVAARSLLDELTQAGLLATPVPGRYACHDLLHVYARNLAEALDSEEQRQAATRRVLDYYLHTAHAAERLLDPVADPVIPTPPAPAVTPQPLTDRQLALDWFTAEHPVLLAAVAHAAATGWDIHCGQLAWTLWTFLDRLGHWHDQATIGRAAVAAAGRLADPAEQARAHRLFAHAHTRLGHFTDAATELRHALDLYCRAGDLTGQAHTHYAFGHLSGQWNRPAQALDHAQQARKLYRTAGHQAGQANTLNQIGWCHAVLGNHRQALTCCRQALALHQELGDRVGQAQALDSLGYAHHNLGNRTRATTCYRHALDLHRDIGNHYYAAVTLTHLGDINKQYGDTEVAAAAWQQALTIFDDLEYADADQLRDKLASL